MLDPTTYEKFSAEASGSVHDDVNGIADSLSEAKMATKRPRLNILLT